MTQSINEQIGPLPAIETELHLFEIGRKMLGTNSVPRSHDSALEKRKGGFDRISVNVPHDVHAGTVVNFLVVCPIGLPHGGIVRGCVVSENDFHILRDVLADVLSECSALRVTGMKEAEIAVALTNADNYFFVVVFCDVALAAHLTADVGNIHLDFAIQHRFIGLRHSIPDAMAEIPCCFVAHSDRALNLAGRHALLRFAEQMRGEKPLGQCQMRVVKDRAGCDGELVVTVFAVEQVLLCLQFHDRAFTTQTLWAFREAQTDEQVTALIFGREKSVYIN